jgi:hypothetical protein
MKVYYDGIICTSIPVYYTCELKAAMQGYYDEMIHPPYQLIIAAD